MPKPTNEKSAYINWEESNPVKPQPVENQYSSRRYWDDDDDFNWYNMLHTIDGFGAI